MEIKPDNKFKQNLLLVVIGVCLLVGLMNFGKVKHALSVVIGLFMPLLVGGAIAFILNVPMHFFEKQFDKLQQHSGSRAIAKAKTPLCMIVTLLAFILVIIFIGNVIFPNLVESVKSIVDIVQRSYPGWIDTLESHGINTQFMQKYFPELNSEKIISALKDGGLALLNTASQAATSVFSALTNFVFGLFFALYILASKKRLGRQAKQIAYAYLKKPWADEICEIASLSYKTFANFLSGQCLEAVILGFMFFIALSIGKFPYAATIALIIGAMSLIPFVGAFIGMAFGILLISTEGLRRVIVFVIVFLVVQQIEGQIVYPRVVGGSVGLPAIWTLLAVVVGGKVSGIFGIILFIPLFSVLYALLRRSVYTRLKKKSVTVV